MTPCGVRLNSTAADAHCRRRPEPGSDRCWQHGGRRRLLTNPKLPRVALELKTEGGATWAVLRIDGVVHFVTPVPRDVLSRKRP